MKSTDVAVLSSAIEPVIQPMPVVEMTDAEILASLGIDPTQSAKAASTRTDGKGSNGHDATAMAATWSKAHEYRIVAAGRVPAGTVSSSGGHSQPMHQGYIVQCNGTRCMAEQTARGKAPGMHFEIVAYGEYVNGFESATGFVKGLGKVSAAWKRTASDKALTEAQCSIVKLNPSELRERARKQAQAKLPAPQA